MSDPQKRPAPFSLRLTQEERVRLEQAAGDIPLGAYIRDRLLGDDAVGPRRRGKSPVKDHQALSQVLGLLGQSRIGNNLNQLAKAAHLGTLLVEAGTDGEIREALDHLAAIRSMLIVALGLSEESR